MPQPEQVAAKLEALRNDLVTVRNALASRYSGLPTMDPRLVVARHIKAVASSTYLSWLYVTEDLARHEWWIEHFGAVPPAGQDEVNDYETLTAAAFIVFSFSLFEAGTRRVVRAIDSAACDGGAADFKGIYEWLLARLRRDGWTYTRGGASEFLDVFRLVRNTMHNNGVYYSRTGANSTVTWNGTTYQFVHGAAPAFIDWDFNVDLVKELALLNQEIMEAPTVSGLPPMP